jgi:predicted outer membrane repeat protein
LLTNTWMNTIDAFAPQTNTQPIADTLYNNVVPFDFEVADDPGGCGVQFAEILLSSDNAIFQSNGLLNGSDSTSLTLNWGTTYYYKVAGTDFVENQEEVVSDSFYIIPRRSIQFLTPDKDVYCLGDTLQIETGLISIPFVDLFISVDSGMTYTLLATEVDTWPYYMVLDSGHLHPYLFIKASSEADNIENISIPFTVNTLPELTTPGPIEGCDNEILFAESNGANEFLWWPDSIIGNTTGRFTNVYAEMSQFAWVQGTDVYGCKSVDSVWINVYPTSVDTVTQALCEGDSISIDGQWITEEGYYPVMLFSVQGCDSVQVSEVYFESPCIWAGGQNVFVDKDATGDNNGTSWENAFVELRDAVYVAGRYENVQSIWVAEGVYAPHPTNRDTSFILRDSIKIFGGFLGFETELGERTSDPDLVHLSGDINIADTLWDNSYHTVILSPACQQCVLDGLTITYGHADAAGPDNIGAGVLNEGVGLFKNVVFERNYATDQGGALHSSGAGANLIIENCTFRLNVSTLGKDVVNLSGAQVEFRGANSIH